MRRDAMRRDAMRHDAPGRIKKKGREPFSFETRNKSIDQPPVGGIHSGDRR